MSETADPDWDAPTSPGSEPGDELGGKNSAKGNEPGAGQGASSASAGPLPEGEWEVPFGSFLSAANELGEKQGSRSPRAGPLPEGEGEEPVMDRNAKAAAEAAGRGVRDKNAGAEWRGARGETTARAKRVEADPDARTDMEDADPDSRLAGNNPGGSGGDNTGGGPRKGGSHPWRSASTAQNKGKGESPWSRGEGQGKSQGGDCNDEQPHPGKYWLFRWDSQKPKMALRRLQ